MADLQDVTHCDELRCELADQTVLLTSLKWGRPVFKVVLNERMLLGQSREAMGNLTEQETGNNGTFRGKRGSAAILQSLFISPPRFNILSSASNRPLSVREIYSGLSLFVRLTYRRISAESWDAKRERLDDVF